MNVSVSPKQIPIYVAQNEKKEEMDDIVTARKKTPCCSSHNSPKRKPLKTVSANFQYPYRILEKRKKRSLEVK